MNPISGAVFIERHQRMPHGTGRILFESVAARTDLSPDCPPGGQICAARKGVVMDDEQRRRAGQAVTERIRERGATVPAVARASRTDAKTLRRLMSGETTPRVSTQRAIEKALDWPPGEIERRGAGIVLRDLETISDRELIVELVRRALAILDR